MTAKRISIRRCSLIFSFLCYVSSTSATGQEIKWRVIDWPPFYILNGPHKGQGLYDQMITLVERELPEFQHLRVPMTTARIHKEWKRGNNACHPSVLPGEHGIESKVNSLLLPYRIVSSKKTNLPIQPQQTSLSIDTLLSNSKFTGGITPSRYSPTLNKIVEKHANSPHLTSSPRYQTLVKMLLMERLDYLIEYPPIVSFYAEQEGLVNKTNSFEIAESHQKYLKVVFACTKNEWGKKIIQKINKILIDESKEAQFMDFRTRWYDQDSQKVLRSLYQSVYLEDK